MSAAPNVPTVASADSRHALWLEAGKLRESWYVACASKELRSGRPHAVIVLGLGLVLFRMRGGGVAALLDQCLHRGTALSAGRLENDCLVCPYHGWRYDSSGRVVGIPTLDGDAGSARSRSFAQRRFAALERHGLVWVYMGDEDPDGKPIFEMPFWGARDWVAYYMVNTFEADASALAQNFMDVPHTVHVHDTIFRKAAGRRMHVTIELTPASVEVEYHEGEDAIGMLPWLTNPHRVPLRHTDKFFAPNITRCDYHWGDASGFVITSQMTPLDARRCRVYTLISYKFPFARWLLGLIRPLIHLYTHIVIQQDVRIMRINRRGIDNAPALKPHSVEADTMHVGIERLIEAQRRGTPLPAEKLGTRRASFEI
jgi:phenylpropionate dioxygenase-like ring-hydroxylating dioxygenase large terminal subunit